MITLLDPHKSGIHAYTLNGQRILPRLVLSGAVIPRPIRLPKDLAFGKDLELVVIRSGNVLTVYPAATSIPEMFARLEALPVPPFIEGRDEEKLPERAGL